ncbi:hypothetical protein DEH69_28310, partial [Streptomyces sp. PT12]
MSQRQPSRIHSTRPRREFLFVGCEPREQSTHRDGECRRVNTFGFKRSQTRHEAAWQLFPGEGKVEKRLKFSDELEEPSYGR